MSSQTRVEVLRHFAVPIYSSLVPDFAAHQASLIGVLQELRQRSPGVPLTNRGSWHSETDLHTSDHQEIRWMTTRIEAAARAALAELYAGFVDTAPRIVDCWSVIGPKGAWHTPHHHYPRAWSGVLYVSAEHCVSKSDASDRSGKIEFLNPIPTSPAFFSAGSVAYNPRDGLLLLFPGALQHLVHPHRSEQDRVIVSFNLDVARNSKTGMAG